MNEPQPPAQEPRPCSTPHSAPVGWLKACPEQAEGTDSATHPPDAGADAPQPDAATSEPKFPFTPVPVRARHDGWTVERQYAFIEALAETGIVEEACRRVGMSRTSADNLRRRPCGAPFRRAWEAAIDYSLHLVEEDAFTRSRRGVARPIFYKGEQVGEWRHHDERLTMFLLRSRRPQRYGKWIDRMLAPDAEEAQDDPGIRLDGGLEGIEWGAQDVPPDGLHPQDCRGPSEDEAGAL